MITTGRYIYLCKVCRHANIKNTYPATASIEIEKSRHVQITNTKSYEPHFKTIHYVQVMSDNLLHIETKYMKQLIQPFYSSTPTWHETAKYHTICLPLHLVPFLPKTLMYILKIVLLRFLFTKR